MSTMVECKQAYHWLEKAQVVVAQVTRSSLQGFWRGSKSMKGRSEVVTVKQGGGGKVPT